MPKYAVLKRAEIDPSAEDLAYLAGLIDGEGCFQGGQPVKAEGRTMGSPAIQVLMADRAAVEWCGRTFGGLVVEHGRSDTGRTTYGWKLNRQADLRHLIPILIPYLKIKGLQAWSTLRVVEVLRSQPKYTVPTRAISATSGGEERGRRRLARRRWRAEVAQAQWGVREGRRALLDQNPRREAA